MPEETSLIMLKGMIKHHYHSESWHVILLMPCMKMAWLGLLLIALTGSVSAQKIDSAELRVSKPSFGDLSKMEKIIPGEIPDTIMLVLVSRNFNISSITSAYRTYKRDIYFVQVVNEPDPKQIFWFDKKGKILLNK